MALDLKYLENEIIDQYLYDESGRPWIVGFSGGKDSTMLLQVVWNALKKIDPILLSHSRRIFVVCNDTMVENPRMVKFIKRTLEKIQAAANACKDNPEGLEFLKDSLALQKTKTLMIRKRGLQSDIDNRLNQFIEELKNPVYVN